MFMLQDQFKSRYKSDKIIWLQIENMCGTTKAAAVPVIPDSEGSTMKLLSLSHILHSF
jgi:hypothetical protein